MSSRALACAVVLLAAWGPAAAAPPRALAAFAVPWDPASAAALAAHGDRLDTIAPAWLSVTGPDHAVTVAADLAGRAALAGLRRRPRLLPLVQNAAGGAWDGAGAAALLADPTAAAGLADRLEAEVAAAGAGGAVVDLEALPPDSAPALHRFLAALHARFGRRGWALWATAAPDAADLAALGTSVDRVVLMAYDQHWQTGTPGPIAARDWFRAAVARAVSQLPRHSVIVAVAGYGYDWGGAGPAAVVSVTAARARAAAAAAAPVRDPASGNSVVAYTDPAGVPHRLWFLDADATATEMRDALRAGAAGVALWRLGTEDPDFWR